MFLALGKFNPVSGSLFTVLINFTLFNHSQRDFVKHELIKAGASISNRQAGAVSQQIYFKTSECLQNLSIFLIHGICSLSKYRDKWLPAYM